MTAAPSALSSAVSDVRPAHGNINMERTQMSQSKVFDPIRFRARFAEYWSLFLKEHYRNPEHVAVAFGVRYQTALNWWQGANRPTGDVVAMAGQPFTDFIRDHAV